LHLAAMDLLEVHGRRGSGSLVGDLIGNPLGDVVGDVLDRATDLGLRESGLLSELLAKLLAAQRRLRLHLPESGAAERGERGELLLDAAEGLLDTAEGWLPEARTHSIPGRSETGLGWVRLRWVKHHAISSSRLVGLHAEQH
jgi:hypothetical protein